jgi:hypothetical protein
MRARFPVALAVAGLLTMSCGGVVDPSQNTSQVFSGTIVPGGSPDIHPFTAANTGEFTVKITALAPNTSAFVGLQVAQDASNGSCTSFGGLIGQNNFAQLNVLAMSSSIISGRYCVLAFDIGSLTAAETYSVTVSHP